MLEVLAIYFNAINKVFDMATKDFFALIREGDYSKIQEYVHNLRDLTAIESALDSDPALVGLVGDYVRFRLAR